ncbi:MAG TPA: HAD family hydrolase [Candidatus Baltobacteraceae bacterium]|jgi:putative hydrolase of the HAD superfamily|nr:HAD family hydrolase [Candidatus Baltobacteraceae bacterium]
MRDIRAVLFDLDDTLHDDTFAFTTAAEEVAREVAAEHGIDAIALKDAYIAEAEGFWHRLTSDQVKTKLSALRTTMWGNALTAVGLADPDLAVRSASNYNAYRKKYFSPFPGAIDLLRDLKARGKKLGIVTNGVSETHHEKIALLQIAQYFDAIFLADEVGMVKPDPLLFAHACQKLDTSPANSAMVGDRYDRDIAGAREAGLYTIWVNVRSERVPAGCQPPDATVQNIAQAAQYLR